MADLGSMNLQVGADVSGVITGLNKAQTAVTGFGTKAATEFKKAGAAVGEMGSKVGAGSNQAAFALTNLGRVAQDAPFGFIGIQNNINPLLESFQRLKVETGSTGGALKALAGSLTGAAGIGLAVSVATGVLTVLAQNGFFKAGKEASKAKEEIKAFNEAIKGIQEGAAKEQAQVLILVKALESEVITRKEKADALKELQSINPKYFGDLRLENGLINNLTASYEKYKNSIIATIQNKIDSKSLEAVLEKINTATEKQQKNAIFAKSLEKEKADIIAKGGASYKGQIDAQLQMLTNTDQLTRLEKERDIILARIAGRGFEGEIKGLVEVAKKVKEIKEIKEKELKYVGAVFKIKTSAEILIDLKQVEKEANDKLGKDIRIKPIKIPTYIAPPDQAETAIALQAVIGSFEQLGASIGDALSGKSNVVGSFFGGISSLLATSLKELGKYIITASTLIAKIKDSLNAAFASNPALGIAVGIGLIAVGSALQNSIPKFATGTQNFSGGSAWVGERGPELVTLPKGANVIPNDKLGGMSGGGATVLIPNVTLRGQDLIIAFNRASQSNSRSF